MAGHAYSMKVKVRNALAILGPNASVEELQLAVGKQRQYGGEIYDYVPKQYVQTIRREWIRMNPTLAESDRYPAPKTPSISLGVLLVMEIAPNQYSVTVNGHGAAGDIADMMAKKLRETLKPSATSESEPELAQRRVIRKS